MGPHPSPRHPRRITLMDDPVAPILLAHRREREARTAFDAGRRFVIHHKLTRDVGLSLDGCLKELTVPEHRARFAIGETPFRRHYLDGFYSELRWQAKGH